MAEAKRLLDKINLVKHNFSTNLPLSPLHWIISDNTGFVVVESLKEGIKIFDNPVGVMTNNPSFDYQLFNLNNYRGIGRSTSDNRFSLNIDMKVYCQGLGAIGLPGDLSSMSRFVRIVFNSQNSVCDKDEESSVGQFFHLLGSVEMTRGCCCTDNGGYDITQYSSCMNTEKGLYYYTTYENRCISCVNMHHDNLDGNRLTAYRLIKNEHIYYHN